MSSKKILIVVIVLMAAGILFWAGIKYEQIHKYQQVVLKSANSIGAQIVQTNQLIQSFGGETKAAAFARYNRSTLSDIGCSDWFAYLDHIDEKKLAAFSSGVDFALEKISDDNKKNDACIARVVAYRHKK